VTEEELIPTITCVVHLGSLDAFAGRLLIADPCSAAERLRAVGAGLHVKVRPGTYDAYGLWARYDRYPQLGQRMSHAFVGLRDETMPIGRRIEWADPIGDVAVDTGRLAFYDERRYPFSQHDALYDRTPHVGPIDDNLGVVTSTGTGDGSYPVYVCRHNGVVVGLLACYLFEGFDMEAVLDEFRKVVPFLAPRPKGVAMPLECHPPHGSIASRTTVLAWAKYIELLVNGIEVAELNTECSRASGAQSLEHNDVPAERAKLAAAMRFLRDEMAADLGMTDEDLDRRFGALSRSIEEFLTAAREMFPSSLATIPETKVQPLPELERLERTARMFEADRGLDWMTTCHFNPGLKIRGDVPIPPADWSVDPDVIPLHGR
jgi:hypothetical protein